MKNVLSSCATASFTKRTLTSNKHHPNGEVCQLCRNM